MICLLLVRNIFFDNLLYEGVLEIVLKKEKYPPKRKGYLKDGMGTFLSIHMEAWSNININSLPITFPLLSLMENSPYH